MALYRKNHRQELRDRGAIYRKKYKIKTKKRHELYRIKNKTKLKVARKLYYQKIKQRVKLYAIQNREKIKAYQREYYLKHKQERAEYGRKYNNFQRKTNINFRIMGNLRSRLRWAFKYKIKKETTMKLVGCSIEQLKQHLEPRFVVGMTWENYGKWEIDHIKPCCSFDLSQVEEQRKCFHYTNLQPLWKKDNLKKGKRYVDIKEKRM